MNATPTTKILVWDIPTRLFHWAFAAALGAALGTSLLVDHDRPIFRLHMLFGIIAVFLLCVRIVLGVAGSRYARFASFPLRPSEFISYLITAITRKTKRYPGNNPGSATAALIMFALAPLLLVTGTGFGGESFDELHEILAYALLAVIALHVAGLAWHTLRHKENIAMAMISGKKDGHTEDGIGSAHPVWGLVLLVGAGLWIAALFSNHDVKARTVQVPAVGIALPLGDSKERGEHQRPRDKHDDDD